MSQIGAITLKIVIDPAGEAAKNRFLIICWACLKPVGRP
jgi:hypothetical protein